MKQLNHKRGTNILFFNEGLAGGDKVTPDTLWRLNTLRTLRKLFNETEKTIDYLKIDIEYWEWEALDQAIQDGSLSKVKQIGLEVHRHEIYSKTSSVDNYKLYFKIFSKLRDLGFYRWNSHLNPQSYTAISTYSGQKIMCCHEIIFINVNYLP
ncbi:hypothetical protein HELRODRAFT_164523 [Helobdella robusta]|uniref:Methyltransferase FkbM domain-containing protein n=1 Tax=Helobdella robusta TaxID=6412 RepID=T1EVI8_HELRO|nr:hypothetical protein HELRODRAFT_164523 [Helobdella robusta]ESN94644.1 hypothetical protein HELRODRAFT_164523 [Helobdella robusta]